MRPLRVCPRGSGLVLSQKSQYAVRAVFELAKRHGSGPVKASQIADAQYIPVRFLENILAQLRLAGIIESVRGKEGGYRLSRPPHSVSVGEVIRLIQGPVSEIECFGPGAISGAGAASTRADSGGGCPLRPGCVLLPMWEKAHRAMMAVYEGTSFQDLVDEETNASECQVIDYAI
jgi:Rrf2 family cysteine metabolism transcriptional repressor